MATHTASWLRRFAGGLALAALLIGARPGAAQTSPDFDSVAWTPIGCDAADLTADSSPSSVNFVGDANTPAAYYAFDASYLYFRYRMDGDPDGPGGFAQSTWTALMQTPTGNPFQYQYQLSLDGSNDTIQVWQNTVASDIDFTPLFHDDSEVQLFSQPYNLVNTSPLARSLAAGSSFGNNPDYFVDFAFPVSTLIAEGVIANGGELAGATFFPATSTNGSNYNKGHLNCPFLPITEVALTKDVTPGLLLANTTTPVTYTIVASNQGGTSAKGLVIEDITLPAYMSNVVATVSSDNPGVTWTLMSTNPLQVKVPFLPVGASVTVELTADATPNCSSADFMNLVTSTATNAADATASAFLDVQTSDGIEICDGNDNDCDGQSDEGGDAICDDGDACNGSETCTAGSCQAGSAPNCDDGNACTSDSCDPTVGCQNPSEPDGTPCSDGNACTGATGMSDSCQAGVCNGGDATVCSASDQCHDTGTCDPSTGMCSNPAMPDGTPCNDGNACTGANGNNDSCQAGSCNGGETVVCSASDQCHTAGSCDPSTGVCSNPEAPDGTPCNDGNACTGANGNNDSCQAGSCNGGEAVVCSASDQCHTTGSCDASTGLCSNPEAQDGTPCSDGNACTGANGTSDTCQAGSCTGGDPVVCSALDQCHAAGACDTGTGVCSNPAVADGTSCDDGAACTSGDACQNGTCSSTPIAGCVPCSSAADCADGNTCTTDICTAQGVCAHQQTLGCTSCSTTADCDDGNTCTSEICGTDGSCGVQSLPGCQPCTTAADCDDQNTCTTESCDAGVCAHAPVAGCEARELCGNCIDDDGDGLVDSEDDDCCTAPVGLELRRLVLKPATAKVKKNRMRMNARTTSFATASFDPMQQDTSIQVSDANGQIFCQTVGSRNWKHPRRRMFRFRDKAGSFAGGLKRGNFKMAKKNGRIVFRTRGKNVSLGTTDGHNVLVTLRVGNQCAQSTMTLRAKRRGLVYP